MLTVRSSQSFSTVIETELVALFQALMRKWYGPTPVSEQAADRLAGDYSSLMRRLADKPELADLIPELVADFARRGRSPRLNDASAMFLAEAIQFIEKVYTAYHLEHGSNRANPRSAGWMSLFRFWVRSPLLYEVWTKVRGNYSSFFQQFMNEHLRRSVEDVPMRS